MRQSTPRLRAACIALAGTLAGCGNAVDCAINGDNLKGRVTYGAGVTVHQDANLVIQYSVSSFATDFSNGIKTNPQGLLTVPYGFCAPNGTFQLRAFQDLNGNGSLDSGEPSGRLDGTSTGDATYLDKVVVNATSTTEATRVSDADIVIDNP